MGILFLDIDGVLNHHPWFHSEERRKADEAARALWKGSLDDPEWRLAHSRAQLDPACVARLNVLVEATRCEVVVSSTWRMGKSPELLEELLRDRGFKHPILDTTPVLSDRHHTGKRNETHRGMEIECWLRQNRPDERHIAIVDDDGDFGRLRSWWVRTSSTGGGLTTRKIGKLDATLLRPCPVLDTPNPLWTPEAMEALYGPARPPE